MKGAIVPITLFIKGFAIKKTRVDV